MILGKWNWRLGGRAATRFENLNWGGVCRAGGGGTVAVPGGHAGEWWAAGIATLKGVGEPAFAMSEDERALWQRHAVQHDLKARALLIERYLGLARRVAATMYALRSDNSVEFAEYLQYARVGLLEAMDRYEPERDVSFSTYASYRIRGAVLNGLETVSEQAAQKHYRREVMKERAESLQGKSGEDRFAALVDFTISLALGYALEESGIWKETDESEGVDPYRVFELKFLQERLVRILEAMPDRERNLIRMHYFDHLDFQEIARRLGLSKSRIAQLHRSALTLMRQAYEALEGFDARY
jgi:RNA polymerase sigma factor FliA